MSEFLQQEGKLALKRKEAERLRLQIRGLVKAVRDCLDPTEQDPCKLRTDVAAEAAFQLDKLRTDYLAITAEISEINSYLGRG